MSLLRLEGLTRRYSRRDPPALDHLTLELEKGEILALLGPSGCGKTTTLRLIAGFERPDAGMVELRGRVMADARTFIPPEQRGVGMVFQEYTLFSHLSVEQNIAFGLRRLGHPDRAQRVNEMLEMVALTGLARRYPHELSGGQQQRAALARALAPHPSVLLLDEPFSNLDATLRTHMLHEVYTILRDAGTTAIFVTHDQEEAFMVADRVAVLNRGRLEQVGRPEEIYHLPATRFVARFVGKADCVPGCVTAAGIETEIGTFPNTANLAQATPVDVMIRPDQLELIPDPSGKAIVISHRFRGGDTLVVVQLPSGRILQSSQPPTLIVIPQERVKVAARATHVVAFLATQPER